MVDRFVPTPNSQTRLLRYIQDNPGFAVSGDAFMPRVAQRFLQGGQAQGLSQIALPRCMNCTSARLLTKTLADGRRVCASCERAAIRRACDGCGRDMPIAVSGRNGGWCSTCWRRRPESRKVCIRCNLPGLIQERTTDGPVCARCASGTVLDCAGCGEQAKVWGYLLGGPQCQRCYNRIRRIPSPCPSCGVPRIVAYLDVAGERSCADCAKVPARFACHDCGSEIDLIGRLCAPCTIRKRSLELITRDDGTINETYRPVHDHLLASPRVRAVAEWTRRSASAALIRELVNGRIELNHDGLDRASPVRAVDHVRGLLITIGMLPNRDEQLARASRGIDTVIAAAPVEHRALLRRYANWGIINDLRNRSARRPLVISAPHRARMKMNAAHRLLEHLEQIGSDLRSLRQAQLEDFLLDSRIDRNVLASFLRWAHDGRLLGDVEVTFIPSPTPSPGLSHAEHEAAILRLNSDPSVPVRARVAGLLIALFGQSLTRLVTLTHGDVIEENGAVSLRLGSEPVRLPPTLARLSIDLRDAPRPWADDPLHRWFFPSKNPGKAIHPQTIGSQLDLFGFDVAALRNAALFNVAGKIPLGPLSELTGIGSQALGRWATIARRDWSAYIPLRTGP